LFRDAVDRFELPRRVRGDADSENIKDLTVAVFWLDQASTTQRIERLLAEVNRVLSGYFRDLFLFMEAERILQINNLIHIRALHLVFIPRINKALTEYTNQSLHCEQLLSNPTMENWKNSE
ncbi:MAG: hypothetical protein ACRC90_07035, partial [Lactococcus garvieae]